MVLLRSAPLPLAVLEAPVVLNSSAPAPVAVLKFAVVLWNSYGGSIYAPELATVMLGHLLNAGLTIALASAMASVADHPSTAAILTLSVTVGTWIINFVAAVNGGLWERAASYTPTAMVADMGLTSGSKTGNAGTPTTGFAWSADAKEKLDRLPSFVKPMVQSSVEAFARKQGYQTITLQVMDDSKSDSSNGITWTPEAEKRLENIPDFIRPMARKEVERVAKDRGMETITAQVMDDVKDKFMKFM